MAIVTSSFVILTDRNDDIKVVEIGGFDRKVGNSDFSHRICFGKFTFFVNIQNMLVDGRARFSKQYTHLLNRQPNRFVLKQYINRNSPFFRLIDNNLSFGIFCKILCFHKKNLIALAKVQQKFDIHKDFEIKIEFTCIFIAKYLGMSTNVRPYFRGGTACRVGALEVHKLKKNDTRK